MELPPFELVSIDALRADPRNPNQHPKSQIKLLAKNQMVHGFNNPILAQPDYTIIAGHGRWAAAKLAGFAQVPVIILAHLSPEAVRAYQIADNELGRKSRVDREMLAQEVQWLVDLGYEVELTGLTIAEADILMDDAEDAAPARKTREDRAIEPGGVEVTRPGDIWLCGPHRVAQGDLTQPTALEALMGGDRARAAVLDSPYNKKVSSISGLGRVKHREFAMGSGEMTRPQFTEFLTQTHTAIADVCLDGAIVFSFIDWAHVGEMEEAFRETSLELKNICTWAKTNAGMGSFYRSQTEFVFVGKVGSAPHTNNFGLGDTGRYRSNLWTYKGVNSFGKDRRSDIEAHPTVKPWRLIKEAIEDVSARGEIIVDGFGGSGTTLIAAHSCGRVARLLEIDCRYVDTICRRWINYTGKTPTRASDGVAFDEAEAQAQAQTPQEEIAS